MLEFLNTIGRQQSSRGADERTFRWSLSGISDISTPTLPPKRRRDMLAPREEHQMRSVLIATVASLAFATAAGAVPGPANGHYYLDAHGRCRVSNGQYVPANMCSAPTVHPHCRQGVNKPCGKTCIPVAKTCHV